MCRTRKVNNVQSVNSSYKEDDEREQGVNIINNIVSVRASESPLYVDMSVDGKQLKMEIDSGAVTSVIPENIYNNMFPNVPLQSTKMNLKTILGEELRIIGEINVPVEGSEGQKYTLPLVIVRSSHFKPLLGRTWLDQLMPEWRREIGICLNNNQKLNGIVSKGNEVETYLQSLKNRYPSIFDESKTGHIFGHKAHIHVKEGAKPIFLKPYPVPYALLPKVEAELARLEKEGIIVPVTRSEWASPIVIVPKPDSSIRLCVDFKRTVNQVVTTEHYPLPKIEDLLASLSGGKCFTVIDLSNAYLQLEVAEDSRELLTINTHKGLYRFTKLPFGISCAPAIFQKTMDEILKGLSKTCCYLDDVLVAGEDEEDLKRRVNLALDRLREHNVKVNSRKCVFMSESVEYLGHIIDGKGIRPSKKNFEAIMEAPPPGDTTQLRSYLGMLNFYGKFIPNLSTWLKPLYRLLEKRVPWAWSDDCEEAFKKSKELLHLHQSLVHYDPTKPLLLACDASPYGIGAVLMHDINGVEQPIMFASSTLAKAEQNFAQIEREALALIFGVKRFHKYLCGRKFTLVTDHQPLKYILDPKKGIPTQAANRIQRWALTLSSYDYNIKYRKGKELVIPDALSRLPLKENFEDRKVAAIECFSKLLVNATRIAEETREDPTLAEVVKLTKSGWSTKPKKDELKPFWTRRNELTLQQGCLLWGNRVIIPKVLQPEVLNLLHEQHVGIVRMKMQARSYVWWPSLNDHIETLAAQCPECQFTAPNQPAKVNYAWPSTSHSWERVHVDLAVLKVEDAYLLVMIDSHSKWVEVDILRSPNAVNVVQSLRHSFSTFGLPETLVTDNGPPFSSNLFQEFCDDNGIRLLHTPTYHPKSNGVVERVIRVLKSSLNKQSLNPDEDVPLRQRIDDFLFSWRNTPTTSTKKTPAEMVFQKRPRTKLDLLKPSPAIRETNTPKGAKYRVEDRVLVRTVREKVVHWWPGIVTKIVSPTTYIVRVAGQNRFVHLDHLKLSCLKPELHTIF